jgi:hypothetical protein
MPTQNDTQFFVTTCIETLLFLARRPGGGLADMYELMEIRDDLTDTVLSRIVTICNNGKANTHNFPEVMIHAIVACESEMASQVEATFLRAFAPQLAEGSEWFAMREEDIEYIEGLSG